MKIELKIICEEINPEFQDRIEVIKIALKDEYIDKLQGEKLQLYNKQRVTIFCHVSYCRMIGRYGCGGKETILHDIKIEINNETFSLPEEEYLFYNTDCFDKFVGCDVKFTATSVITRYDDEYYIDILRPSKISKVSLVNNEVTVTYFTRYTETFIYNSLSNELPAYFYERIREMDKHKVGGGRYFTMTIQEAYECDYGRINVK